MKKGWAIFNYALSASPNGDVDEAANEFERLSRKAIEIDPYDAEGHVSLGDKLIWWGDLAQGAVEVERAPLFLQTTATSAFSDPRSATDLGQPLFLPNGTESLPRRQSVTTHGSGPARKT